MDFRSEAQKSLKRAEAELATLDDSRLKYAALELRLTIEALTYERVRGYKEHLDPVHYPVWQPKKLMQALLEIDPGADRSSTISIGVQPEKGVPSTEMKVLGTESVLSMKAIKDHYDSLGSFLHMPILKQISEGIERNPEKLRAKCEAIVSVIKDACYSRIWNAIFLHVAEMSCSRCNAKMSKALRKDREPTIVRCFECGAEYKVEQLEGYGVRWVPKQTNVRCLSDICDEISVLWDADIKYGARWKCRKCQRDYGVGYAPYPLEELIAAQNN